MVAQSTIQYSFNSGEWSPRLNARVDLSKYNSGAELLQNFFVDYRGGATIRPGSKYILQAYDSANVVRLIPFQASTAVGYALEFGQFYMRPYYNGAPVLETGVAITGISKANPCVVTVANTWSVGDVVFIENAVGMTQVNDRYFKIAARTSGSITLADLNGVAINSSAYTTWTSGGTVSRVYQIASPYAASDLALLKFTQNVSDLIICHPSYQPYLLSIISAVDWVFNAINIGATVTAPTNVACTATIGAGGWNYAYVVTAVDINGQESVASIPGTISNLLDIRSSAGTISITWTAVANAVSYNVYKTILVNSLAVPTGAPYGYIGNVTGTAFRDSNVTADFSIAPPIARNPFVGGNVSSVAVTAPGTYTTIPTITFTGTSSVAAAAIATLKLVSWSITSGGNNYTVGEVVQFDYGIALVVASVSAGVITAFQPLTYPQSSAGIWSGTGSAPGSLNAFAHSGAEAQISPTWGIGQVLVQNGGFGYSSAPTVGFSAGGATAVATITSTLAGYPTVPSLFQQRLWLLGRNNSPQSLDASQTGSYYNYNISNPIQADDAISGTLSAGQLNTIKAAISMQPGLVILSDRASWLVNGGSAGSAVAPGSIVANPQAYNGISDVPPIVSNFDILYVQAKGSIVRNMAFSFYTNVYTGTDISVISSHLFYGYNIVEWAWAEEPFKVVWAVRDDGKMLTLTFEKQQEFIAWAHSETDGLYKSVCTVTEEDSNFGLFDAVYTVVERTVNGNTVKYIERFELQDYSNGVEDAWQVDSGLRYDSTPATSFTGAEHLAGETVTGLADGVVITPFVMPTNGFFTLATAASKVTIGLGFTARLKSLRVDLGSGQSTIQGKAKRVPAIVVRVADTLGLKAGTDFDHLVPMKDLIQGNVSSMKIGETDQVVSDLVDGDARVFLNPAWTTTGQYCIEQSQPLPATICGLIPELVVGDTK